MGLTFARKGGLSHGQPPHKEHPERKTQNTVVYTVSEFIGELLRGRFLPLGFLNQPDNFLQRALRLRPEHDHFDGSPKIHRAGQNGITNSFFNRSRFSGQV